MDIKYIFFLPPNEPDDREHYVPHDQVVASLEGEHWLLKQEIATRQQRLADVEAQLSTLQPPIIQAAHDEKIRREAEEAARYEMAIEGPPADSTTTTAASPQE